MKFLHLRIANYRGTESAEVPFAPGGITLIQGPNETGKTSLAEAIQLLFIYPDSSKAEDVKAIRPVHRDEGPEIELHAQSGPYEFKYFKRFYKKPETKLTITRPKPENHTGREAHDRANSILGETLDVSLWRALAIQQGAGIEQPDLTKQTSLSAALDRAAGGNAADPREEDIFEKVHEEYTRYYTERDAEKKELKEASAALPKAQEQVSQIEKAIKDLEADIDRTAKLQDELKELKSREAGLEQQVSHYSALLEDIKVLESSLEKARFKLETTKTSEQMAQREQKARQDLIEAVAKAGKAYSKIELSSAQSLTLLSQAEEKFAAAEKSFDDVDHRKKEAETLAILRRNDFDHFSNKLHMEQLKERKDRIDNARNDAAKAEETLKHNKVKDATLKKIQDAEKELIAALARLETGAPSVVLQCLGECRLSVDGSESVLGKDEIKTILVAERSTIVIPDIMSIEVKAGSSIEGLSRKLEEAALALEKLCKAAGVNNADDARSAFEERQEASRKITNKAQIEKENLRDLTYDQLDRKLLDLQQTVPDYLASRTSDPPICLNLEAAKKEWSNSMESFKVINDELENKKHLYERARRLRDDLNTRNREIKVEHALIAKTLENAREALDKARANCLDDKLDANLVGAGRAVADETSNVKEAAASLNAKNPERVKELADTAKESLKTTQVRRRAANTELTEVQTRLKIHGEEGLHEQLNMALANLNHRELENRSLFRRAGAARLLLDIMREERDMARKAYIRPIKEKVEKLCHLVFDGSCEVDISDDLQIVSRTMDNITVPFEYLSAGAKEQLSLIFRLACSMIVANDGDGTPIVLDDALGYTDSDRLPLMGAVFAKAAKECQIVILTCVPNRYSNVGAATIIPIG